MTVNFQLTPYLDLWHVTFLVEKLATPVFLCHTSTGLGWSTDRIDAKPFQLRYEAIQYVLNNTQMRVYREPIKSGFIEVDFHKRTVSITFEDRPPYSIPFEIALKIYELPLFKPKIKELAKL